MNKEDHIKYKGKGKHSVNELEKIIEQREEEIHLIKKSSYKSKQELIVEWMLENDIVGDKPYFDSEEIYYSLTPLQIIRVGNYLQENW